MLSRPPSISLPILAPRLALLDVTDGDAAADVPEEAMLVLPPVELGDVGVGLTVVNIVEAPDISLMVDTPITEGSVPDPEAAPDPDMLAPDPVSLTPDPEALVVRRVNPDIVCVGMETLFALHSAAYSGK